MIEKRSDNELLLKVNRSLYETEAVLQASYKFTNRCYIRIDPISEDVIGVYFKIKDGDLASLERVVDVFCNDIIDQQNGYVLFPHIKPSIHARQLIA